jgi:hypothetical protein
MYVLIKKKSLSKHAIFRPFLEYKMPAQEHAKVVTNPHPRKCVPNWHFRQNSIAVRSEM